MQGLEVRELSVHYPGAERSAVDRVSLGVGHAEIVALTGPSGCGKSTLLRAIAGIEPMSSGEVLWDGEAITHVPTHKRGFGMVFQDGQLFAHQNVAQNIGYGLRVLRMPKHEQRERISQLLELINLPDAGRRAVETLSGGERQRVALARSLAPKPRLLLLDEPLSALDRDLRESLAAQTRRILRETQTAAIFVTHDFEEAEAISDRRLSMRAGAIVKGRPREQVD